MATLGYLVLVQSAWTASPSAAAPLSPALQGIRVVQGGVELGTIQPYRGQLTGIQNYNYLQPSGAPINGPPPQAREGRIFFYQGADGLHFNVIFNAEGSGNGTANWTLAVTGSDTDPFVQFSDDPVPPAPTPELLETPSDNQFAGSWSFQARVDGGVIGPLGGAAWTLSIDQLSYGSPTGQGIASLRVFGDSSRSLSLSMNVGDSGDIRFIAIPVPEPHGWAVGAVLAVGLVLRHNGARVAVRRRATPLSQSERPRWDRKTSMPRLAACPAASLF